MIAAENLAAVTMNWVETENPMVVVSNEMIAAGNLAAILLN